MKFLGGDRFIQECHPGEEISQGIKNLQARLMEKGVSLQEVYKVLVFLPGSDDLATPGAIRKLSDLLRTAIHPEVLVVPLFQAPLNAGMLLEAHYYDSVRWDRQLVRSDHAGAQVFRSGETGISCGAVHIPGTFNRKTAQEAFESLKELLAAGGFSFPRIIRQWHYIQDILGPNNEAVHYHVFNEVRSQCYAAHLKKGQYPAATGIGMQAGGMVIEYIAAEGPGLRNTVIDNPCQIPAYDYSAKMGGAAPKFERGRILSRSGQKVTFISGTAAIRGEQTMHPGDTLKQTELTIDNINQLLKDLQGGKSHASAPPNVFDYLRIYLKDRKDHALVKERLDEIYGAVPAVWLQADICRKDLMIEIEGTLSETSQVST